MSSRIVVREIGLTLILLLVSSAQAVNYERYRHDEISVNWNNNVILTSRDFLEQLNFVTPKASYTLQEATEYLLHFGGLLRARILDTFGSLLYDYYDDFSIAEVEALRKIYTKIFERRYNIFNLVPTILMNQDTRPSRICAEIYSHTRDSCLRSSASVCRRIRKQHDLPHPDDHSTPLLNVTYQVYHLSKISKQYPRGFSLTTLLRLLQREVLMITPNLLSGLVYNVRYENYDDDVRLAEKELVRHFREISKTSEISVSTIKLSKFHTINSFFKYYIATYAEKFSDNNLKKYALLIAKRITDDIGMIDENIHLLGNVYENRVIHLGYLFDLVLPDDLLENDVIEAKKYLVMKLNKFNVVEKYLRIQKYQQATPDQLIMEITGQLKDIDFAKSIATSLRMHARFWHRSRMIETLDELLELFDTYENLRQIPRYLHTMEKIDKIKESLRDMKDIPVEILCNIPRACLRIGLQLILHCKLINSQIKDSIKNFLEMSDVCVDFVESRHSVEIPFKVSKTHFSTTLLTPGLSKNMTRQRKVYHKFKATTEPIPVTTTRKETPKFTSTTTMLRTTTPISVTYQEKTTAATAVTTTLLPTTTTSTTTTILPTTTTTLPTTTTTTLPTTTTTISTTLPTTTTTLPTTTTTLPTTITTLPTTTTTTLPTTTTISTTLPTTTTTLPTTTTTLPTTTTTLPTTTTTLPTTITTLPTTTTTLPTTTTTLPTTTTTTLPTTTTTISTTLPTTTTTLPTTTTTLRTTTTTLPTTTTTLPTTTTTLPTTTTTLPTTTTTLPTTTTTLPTTITTLPTTTTTLPTTTTTLPTTTTTLPTTTTTLPTTTTTLPTTTTTLPTTTTTLPTTTTTLPTTTTTLPTTTTTLPTTTTTLPTTTTTLPTTTTTISTTLPTTIPTTSVTTITTTELPMINPNIEMKLNYSKIVTKAYIPYVDIKRSTRKSIITRPPCELYGCTTEQSTETSKHVETTPTLFSMTQSSITPYYERDFTEPTVSSTTEFTPITKGYNCATCLENCGLKNDETPCETSCDSVTEDCNGESNSQECDKNCGCEEEKRNECMSLCSPESSSCEEGDCMTAMVPPLSMNLERPRIRGVMCEIRDLHHRRQLKRLAKMRAISAGAAVVATSHVDIPRPKMSRNHRNQITTKKLYKKLDTKLPYSKSKKVTEYLRKKSLGNRNDKEQRRRKQREQIYKMKRLTRKFGGKLTRKTTMHRTKGIIDSQIKRISERGVKSIGA